MDIQYFFLLITLICLTIALWKKRFVLLLVPVVVIVVYIVVEIILVPAPLIETVKFIFSLQ
ncbi:hypothetical protein SAMN05880501_11594 [Ureibacillus xyleni]|uniref:Uncharacterized protein n=1 Tax=Ureibacillus xyleni TaxID=614648 RepID=A0A285TLH4_9BACL|nr:hypothetical protein [Ureibacillus xyleni]SOC23506.1 hypothetical protein SAMN05880501_11594 [Ureibacillus xyleni]